MSGSALLESAAVLQHFSNNIAHNDLRVRLRHGTSRVAGTAFSKGWQRANMLLDDAAHTLLLASRAASVLSVTADAAAHVEGLLQRAYDLSPEAAGLVHQLRTMQTVLDHMCAQELHHLGTLCTDTSTTTTYEPQWFGDADTTPATIITVVGGVGSQTPQGKLNHLERSARIHQETGAHVVAWEYTAPASIPGGVGSHAARAAAEQLSKHQAELRAQYPNARLIVVAHSYGTVVTGHAAPEADAVVLLGSPGVPTRRFSDETKVVSMLNHADPIGIVGTATGALHGYDPHAPGYPAKQLYRSGDHSSYFDDPQFYEQLRQLSSE